MSMSFNEQGTTGSMDKDLWWLALVLFVLVVLVVVVLVSNTTLFEDGSIQFFNHAGWGFCLVRSLGCA